MRQQRRLGLGAMVFNHVVAFAVLLVTMPSSSSRLFVSAQPTLYEALNQNANYSQFARLVNKVPFVLNMLNTTKPTTTNDRGDLYTLLAPDNQAVENSGKQLGADGDTLVRSLIRGDPALLQELLLLHIIDGNVQPAIVQPKESFLGTYIPTMNIPQLYNVEIVVEPVDSNATALTANKVPITQLNTTVASNGIMHTLDRFFLIVPDIEDFACLGPFVYLCFFVQINEVKDIVSFDFNNKNKPPITLLAPTQEAFLKEPFIKKIIIDLDAWADHGGYLLKNHMAQGVYREASFPPQEALYPIEFQNLNGVKFNIYNDPPGPTFDGKQPLVPDIDLRNGFVQVMNDVLLPKTMRKTMYELLDFTLFRTLIDTAAFKPTVNGDGPLTLFWPTNEALIAMQSEYPGYYKDIVDPSKQDVLVEFLEYHTVPDINIRSYGRTEDVYTFTTSLGDNLTMTLTNGGNTIAVNDASDAGNLPSTVVDGNIFASNGVMHQMDRVLIPPKYRNPFVPETPAPTTAAPTTLPPVDATPAPVTPAPVTPAPVTPAPVTPAPVVTTPKPTIASTPPPSATSPSSPSSTPPSPPSTTPPVLPPPSTTPLPTLPPSKAATPSPSTPSPVQVDTPAPIESGTQRTAAPSLWDPKGPFPAPGSAGGASGGTRSATTVRYDIVAVSIMIAMMPLLY
mmetsp:Transcript_11013/g.15514  ORF Transcript_11013/g.15514 Transcript_11013/m.15514 type:complete len:678 (-) Transcript_11013:145-2178(-)